MAGGRKRQEQSRKSVKAKWKQTCQAQDEVTGGRPRGVNEEEVRSVQQLLLLQNLHRNMQKCAASSRSPV